MFTSRPPGRISSFTRRLATAAALFLTATTAAAQTGTVAGTVTEASTGRGLNQVRLQIVGSQAAPAITDERGRFILLDVAGGQQTLRALRIGYRPTTQAVTVRGGDTARVTLQLSESAVELAKVFVTGTGGAVEWRQVGASIGNIDVAKLSEQIAIPDVGRMLVSKVTGLRSTTVGGGVGTEEDIRICGTASLSLSASAPPPTLTECGLTRAPPSGSAPAPAAHSAAARPQTVWAT